MHLVLVGIDRVHPRAVRAHAAEAALAGRGGGVQALTAVRAPMHPRARVLGHEQLAAGEPIAQLVQNIDIAPTILEAAGLQKLESGKQADSLTIGETQAVLQAHVKIQVDMRAKSKQAWASGLIDLGQRMHLLRSGISADALNLSSSSEAASPTRSDVAVRAPHACILRSTCASSDHPPSRS